MEAGLELIDALIAELDALVDAEAAQDEARACDTLLAMFAKMKGIGDAFDPGFGALEAAIDEEARRLGVAFN